MTALLEKSEDACFAFERVAETMVDDNRLRLNIPQVLRSLLACVRVWEMKIQDSISPRSRFYLLVCAMGEGVPRFNVTKEPSYVFST